MGRGESKLSKEVLERTTTLLRTGTADREKGYGVHNLFGCKDTAFRQSSSIGPHFHGCCPGVNLSPFRTSSNLFNPEERVPLRGTHSSTCKIRLVHAPPSPLPLT